MKIYFQDLNMDAQEKVWNEVREYLKPDIAEEAEEADEEEHEWVDEEEELIDEQVDDYINRHNFGVGFPMTDEVNEP